MTPPAIMAYAAQTAWNQGQQHYTFRNGHCEWEAPYNGEDRFKCTFKMFNRKTGKLVKTIHVTLTPYGESVLPGN